MATGRVNLGRVIAGGLLAGLVINVSEAILNVIVIAADNEAMVKAHNLRPIDNSMIISFNLLGFLLGIVTVWLYAAIRTRYGAGPGTAIMAGMMVFFFAYIYPTAFMAILGLMSTSLMLVVLGWGLVEILVASVAGAWVYKE